MKNSLKLGAFLFLIALALTTTVTVFAETSTDIQPAALQPTDKEVVDTLYQNSYDVFRDLRNDLGVYRDSILLEAGENYHPSSVAATGVGLMSLTIADKKNWETATLEKAKKTMATMIGETAGFHADRTKNGFYRHFINMRTGAQEWNSEYSTIDTAIFVSGALFAANYFKDEALNTYANQLYHSIDFEAAIADIDTGGIYLTMNEDGTGGANSITLPYNEYIIVAWLAYNQNRNNPESKAVKFWQEHYATPKNLLTKDFNGLSLLTDNADHYLPSFTFLFPYYMVNMFSTSAEYTTYVENAYQADKLWSNLTKKTKPYEWGNGAGASLEGYGYHADAINNNQSLTISPHIISGFLPVNPSGYQDLVALYKNNKGIYRLQSDDSKEILWRYSLEDPNWKANSIQGIDYSTFLFGLATADSDFSLTFFQQNNNFFKQVTFDLNGGTSSTTLTQNLVVGESVQAPKPEPTRPGYAFAGWNTSADGSGAIWDFSKTLTPDSDITLYAQWTADTNNVAFDLNGGSGITPPNQSIAPGAKLLEPTSTPTRSGFTFSGWSTSADGSSSLWNFATTAMPNHDITLYAQWTANGRSVAFDLNGGSGTTPPNQSIVVGAKLLEPTSTPTRSGFTFSGWSTSADGSSSLWNFATAVMPDYDITLYAQWKKDDAPTSGSTNNPTEKPVAKTTTLPQTGEHPDFLGGLGLFLTASFVLIFYKKKRTLY